MLSFSYSPQVASQHSCVIFHSNSLREVEALDYLEVYHKMSDQEVTKTLFDKDDDLYFLLSHNWIYFLLNQIHYF